MQTASSRQDEDMDVNMSIKCACHLSNVISIYALGFSEIPSKTYSFRIYFKNACCYGVVYEVVTIPHCTGNKFEKPV